MAQRTVALSDGKFIGIETIYTVIDGRQINIPDKLQELRAKSRNNELFCPCGCGANLILVAGDKNLCEQHFRIKDSDVIQNCYMVTEGKRSVDSKIVLKCWLDDNLHADDLESRVSISAVSGSARQYEFSFISQNAGIALNYCHDRSNLSDEKMKILEENASGISIIHVVDSLNGGSDGQYPEGLMKVQNRQGYCLLLEIEESDYDKADLRAIVYEKNIDGLWKEIVFADGRLKEYRIASDGSVSFRGEKLTDLLNTEKQRFAEQLDEERRRREEAKRRNVENLKQKQLESEKRRAEQRKRQEELEALEKQQAEKRKFDETRASEEKRLRNENFIKNRKADFEQQETQVRDLEGNRWIKCEFCGKIAMDAEFSSYGGPGHINLGTCKVCSANKTLVKVVNKKQERLPRKTYNPTICPECGHRLIEKNGRNGRFIGCTGFPQCRYTRSIRSVL